MGCHGKRKTTYNNKNKKAFLSVRRKQHTRFASKTNRTERRILMNSRKTAFLKTRCTAAEKEMVTEFAKKNGATPSNVILSSIQTCIKLCGQPARDLPARYEAEFRKNMLLSKILNTINLDPTIPDKTKEKIRRELDEP